MGDFTASDGVRIAYDIAGSGPAVLCLAGLSRNGTDYDYVAPFLNDVTKITMDYRGRGKSEWSGAATYTIPREAQDAIELMDHLGHERFAVIGTSRGGIIAMGLAATIKDRLLGIMLNDIGPELANAGLETIRGYIGVKPAAKTFEEAEAMRASLNPGFEGVPASRWAEEVRKHYIQTEDGLTFNYDPALAEAVLEALSDDAPKLWPYFDAMDGLPLAALRGENSNLLTAATFAEMQRRRPDMIAATVAGRGHVPFLDEPESLAVLNQFLERIR